MFLSKKVLTIGLTVITLGFGYQTYALSALAWEITNSDISLGGGSPAVNFTSDGSAPAMVGGC